MCAYIPVVQLTRYPSNKETVSSARNDRPDSEETGSSTLIKILQARVIKIFSNPNEKPSRKIVGRSWSDYSKYGRRIAYYRPRRAAGVQ